MLLMLLLILSHLPSEPVVGRNKKKHLQATKNRTWDPHIPRATLLMKDLVLSLAHDSRPRLPTHPPRLRPRGAQPQHL